MYVAGRVETDSYNSWCHRHQNRRLCLRPHSHESVIFYIHTFSATANLLNIWICMRLADFAHMASQMSGFVIAGPAQLK